MRAFASEVDQSTEPYRCRSRRCTSEYPCAACEAHDREERRAEAEEMRIEQLAARGLDRWGEPIEEEV